MRKSRIDVLYRQLELKHHEAKAKYAHHKKKDVALDKAEYTVAGLTMLVGISVLSTIASPPLGIALGVFSGACGVASLIIKNIHKKTRIKVKKWYDIFNLIDGTLTDMNLLISDDITDEEFKAIVSVYEEYRDKWALLNNTEVILNK